MMCKKQNKKSAKISSPSKIHKKKINAFALCTSFWRKRDEFWRKNNRRTALRHSGSSIDQCFAIESMVVRITNLINVQRQRQQQKVTEFSLLQSKCSFPQNPCRSRECELIFDFYFSLTITNYYYYCRFGMGLYIYASIVYRSIYSYTLCNRQTTAKPFVCGTTGNMNEI